MNFHCIRYKQCDLIALFRELSDHPSYDFSTMNGNILLLPLLLKVSKGANTRNRYMKTNWVNQGRQDSLQLYNKICCLLLHPLYEDFCVGVCFVL